MLYLFVLGREALLSASELITVLEARSFEPRIIEVADEFMAVETGKELEASFLKVLGGTDRVARVLGTQRALPSASELVAALPQSTTGKMRLGLSVLGTLPSLNIRALAHDIKKLLQEQDKKVRFILPTSRRGRLNAAQVLFNKLLVVPHSELIVARGKTDFYIARTEQIQDIVAYEKRDTARPSRDMKTGMLPPKVAQVMINLAAPALRQTILDPFCGLGTVLQEGWLLGHTMIGHDQNQAMVTASEANLTHVQQLATLPPASRPRIFVHDVNEPYLSDFVNIVDAIVTEPYLGRALSAPLPQREIEAAIGHLARLYLTFFKNAYSVLKPGGTILFLLPAWRMRREGNFLLFPPAFLDEVKALGYRAKQLVPQELKSSFPSVDRGELVYARPDALVGREFTLWEKTDS